MSLPDNLYRDKISKPDCDDATGTFNLTRTTPWMLLGSLFSFLTIVGTDQWTIAPDLIGQSYNLDFNIMPLVPKSVGLGFLVACVTFLAHWTSQSARPSNIVEDVQFAGAIGVTSWVSTMMLLWLGGRYLYKKLWIENDPKMQFLVLGIGFAMIHFLVTMSVHMVAYFTKDKTDSQTAFIITIVVPPVVILGLGFLLNYLLK